VSSDLIQSSPFLKPNFLQPLLDVEAEINPWGVFKASRGVLCALLAIGAYASNSVDDVEEYRALKPPWCWDTDRLRLSCSDANDACEMLIMLIRKNEFGLLKDLVNWVVAAQTAVDEWFSIDINSLEESRSSGGSPSGLPYLAIGRPVFRGLVSSEKT